MGGIILLGAYLLVVLGLETLVVGFGFFADSIWPAWSMVIFMTITGLALYAAWPIAVWVTGNQPT